MATSGEFRGRQWGETDGHCGGHVILPTGGHRNVPTGGRNFSPWAAILPTDLVLIGQLSTSDVDKELRAG